MSWQHSDPDKQQLGISNYCKGNYSEVKSLQQLKLLISCKKYAMATIKPRSWQQLDVITISPEPWQQLDEHQSVVRAIKDS